MIDKYTYYADFGSGFTRIEPLNLSLKLSYKVNKDWPAVYDIDLDGSFELFGSHYTTMKAIYQTSGNVDIPFRVYENGDSVSGNLIVTGYITDFNFFDNNEKKVRINKVRYYSSSNYHNNNVITNINNYCNSYGLIFFGAYGTGDGPQDIYSVIVANGEFITRTAWTFKDVLIKCLLNNQVLYLGMPLFDINDAWYDEELIDLTNIRFAPSGTLYKDSSNVYEPNGDTNLNNKISLHDFLNFMKYALNAHWYCDDNYVKFKQVKDLVVNTLDVRAYTTYLDQLNYDPELSYLNSKLRMHSNNDFDMDADFIENKIDYDRNTKNSDLIELPFQTLYSRVDDIDKGTWFVGFVDTADDYIRYEYGYVSSANKDNARFSPANLLNNYHREYIWTDKANFSVCGNASAVAPEYFKPFMELPELTLTLDNHIFYDSLLWKTENGKNYIARVYEQTLDFVTNQTTFKSHLFRKYAS